MDIIVIGAGRIGSAFAFRLALAGHDVTVVARGARLDTLRSERAIVAVDGQRAPVQVLPAFDPAVPHDLAIVTVPEHQLEPLLPLLKHSVARSMLLMFNTFRGASVYRTLIGPERCTFGFPNMTSFLVVGRLRHRIDGPGMVTTLSSAPLASVLQQAGFPTKVEDDMDSFLRSHVAMVVPTFVAALLTWQRRTSLTWHEARQLTGAWVEGFALVRSLGHVIKPRMLAMLSRLPSGVLTALFWALGRSSAVKNMGEFGPAETRWLIDTMAEATPGRTPRLLALRP